MKTSKLLIAVAFLVIWAASYAGPNEDLVAAWVIPEFKTGCLTKVKDKTAIYFAIENGNIEMVKYMPDTDEKWWKHVKIEQIKERGCGNDILGNQVMIITCFGAGEYTPSLYVGAVKKQKNYGNRWWRHDPEANRWIGGIEENR